MSNISIIHRIDRNSAQLPVNYEFAKQAIAECYDLDEVKDWADKSKALASYAKQAADTELEDMAKRIRGRAIRRCGILMKEFDGRGGDRKSEDFKSNGSGTFDKSDAAGQAGLSKRRQNQATRLANIPEGQFDEMIDAENPPTITELEEFGTTKQPIKVHPKQGMKWFQSAYMLKFEVKAFYEAIKERPAPDILLEAMDEGDKNEIRELWPYIKHYMNEL